MLTETWYKRGWYWCVSVWLGREFLHTGDVSSEAMNDFCGNVI